MVSNKVLDVGTEQEFESVVTSAGATALVVVHFWAEWCEPCKQMDEVFSVLAEDPSKDSSMLKLVRVEAEKEELEDVTEKYEVSMVPHFVFIKGGQVVDKLEGADPQGLNQKISDLLVVVQQSKTGGGDSENGTKSEAEQKLELKAKLERLIKADDVVLFMKGSPSEPRCGFSRKAVGMLNEVGAKYGHFDILEDPAVRQGLKEYSNWPTYPQLYVKGELIGGFDIMQEMHENGELKQELGCVEEEDIKTTLGKLINRSPIMLFMKGDKAEPRCGFSAKVVKALNSTGVEYSTFDILQPENQVVRQELKTYSNWPTYPQLYVKGELIGGCDIILEMHENGELKQELSV